MLFAEPTLTSTTGPCSIAVVVLFAGRFLTFSSSAALSSSSPADSTVIWMFWTRRSSCRSSSPKGGGFCLRRCDDDDGGEQGGMRERLSRSHVAFWSPFGTVETLQQPNIIQ